MLKILVCFTFLLFGKITGTVVSTGELTGEVISVMDGDTFKLLTSSKQTVKIRLNGIDAPEKGQDYSKASKAFLGKLLFGKAVKVIDRGRDRYGRTIGDVFTAEGVLVNLELVKAGMAWHFTKYSHDPKLAEAESSARRNRIGLWQQQSPVAPWDFRQRKKLPH